MYAVWKYDQFPYKICGKVVKNLKNGTVQCEGFGQYAFKPIKILNDKKGVLMQEMLKRESEAYRLERMQLDKRFDEIVAHSTALICGL